MNVHFTTKTLTIAALAATLVACGGSTPKAGSPTANPSAPEWVHKGSRVKDGKVYGLGMAGGIRNTELARTTAANRGRAEISKILEVYSASLMKDYQASTSAGGPSSEEQRVEQAIKTFSANLMSGTTPIEYWLDAPKNTWFVLVELDFEKAKALANAKSSGDTKNWIDNNGRKVLDDLEEEEPPPPPPADDAPPADKPAASQPPAAKPGPEAKVGGPAPAWTTGQCDNEKFLCGVGHGPDQKSADLDARAELARIFKANIQSVGQSFQAAGRVISSKTGETWAETQSVSQFSMVSTDKVVEMSEIAFRWDDGKGTRWTLAVVDRAQASTALRDRIEQKDSMIRSKVSMAKETDDNLKRFKVLKQAVGILGEREALNSDLRVIDRSGRGIPPPFDVGDIASMLDNAADSLSIGIAISGSSSDRVQECLEEYLTDKGYQVEAKVSEDEDEDVDVAGEFDVLIKGKVKARKAGKIAGGQVVNTTLSLKVVNAKTNKVIKTVTASKKSTRGDIKSAVSTSVYQLCKKKVSKIAKKIDAAFSK